MIKTISWPNKFPAEEYTVGANWVDLLDGNPILSATFEVITGDVTLTDSPNKIDDPYTKVVVSGGTAGRQAVLCSITCLGGNPHQVLAEFTVNDPS